MEKIGSIVPNKGVIVGDGKPASIGQTLYRWDYRGRTESFTLEFVEQSIMRDAFTGKETGREILLYAEMSDHGLVPQECFTTAQDAVKVTIADGTRVGLDDIVWIWRVGNQPALVQKRICAIKKERDTRWNSVYDTKVQCTYLDNLWPRKENPNELYSSEASALNARPELAEALETALMRAGRNQGERAA